MGPRAAFVLSLCVLELAGCGAHTPTATAPPRRPASTAAATPATTTSTAAPVSAPGASHPIRRRHHAPRPSLVALGLADGRAPQTMQLPSTSSPRFGAEMRALFEAVRSGVPALGMGAFFPETAYAQVKAIADPGSDFRDRLVVDFGLDIAAAHAVLGAGARNAQLIAVRAPSALAHWIPPGVCLNRVGYYELPNARVVYRVGDVVRSFGIASLIGWRGVWYVVHLGAVVRSGFGGVVDAPSLGPGVSAPSSTC